MSHITNYTMHWFLNLNTLNNPESWHSHYKQFVKWLLSERPMKFNRDRLSRNTVNNIINATNALLSFLEEHGEATFKRVKKVAVGRNEMRGLEAIYTPEEQTSVERDLRLIDDRFGTLFNLLNKSGMRVNEALGLHVRSIVFSDVPNQKGYLFERIAKTGLDVYGFILLRDQPSLRSIYDDRGCVPRKPLKARKEIDPEHYRYIPLIDEQLAHELQALLVGARRKTALNDEDKLLFGFTHQQFYQAFARVRRQLKIKDKDIHSTRHTFSTFITKATGGDRSVAEEVLGHNTRKASMRYLHLGEELDAQVRSLEQPDDLIIKAVKL